MKSPFQATSFMTESVSISYNTTVEKLQYKNLKRYVKTFVIIQVIIIDNFCLLLAKGRKCSFS